MTDAISRPVNTRKREIHTSDMPMAQKDDLDISLGQQIVHGEGLPNVSGDNDAKLMADLNFMEEPVTILINENSGSDFPETHVPVQVNGRGAEVWMNGGWVAIGWMPIGVEVTTKRKYVEVLARSKSDSIQTKHEDATVERPQNKVVRRPRQNYPMSIIEDNNPRGREWMTRIMAGH